MPAPIAERCRIAQCGVGGSAEINRRALWVLGEMKHWVSGGQAVDWVVFFFAHRKNITVLWEALSEPPALRRRMGPPTITQHPLGRRL